MPAFLSKLIPSGITTKVNKFFKFIGLARHAINYANDVPDGQDYFDRFIPTERDMELAALELINVVVSPTNTQIAFFFCKMCVLLGFTLSSLLSYIKHFGIEHLVPFIRGIFGSTKLLSDQVQHQMLPTVSDVDVVKILSLFSALLSGGIMGKLAWITTGNKKNVDTLSRIFDITKMLGQAGNGITAFMKFLTNITSIVREQLWNWYGIDSDEMQLLNYSDMTREQFIEFLERYTFYTNPINHPMIAASKDMREKFDTIYAQMVRLQQTCLRRKAPNGCISVINAMMTGSVATAKFLSKTPIGEPFRKTPFWVHFYGERGCGKTTIAHTFIREFIRKAQDDGLIDLPPDEAQWIYVMNGMQKHMTNYLAQKVIAIDDLDQLVSSNRDDSEVYKMILMISSLMFITPQASVEDKGTVLKAEVYFSSGNTGYPEYSEIREIGAYWRRRAVLIRMRNPCESNNAAERFFRIPDCRYDIMHSELPNVVLQSNLTYAECMAYCQQQYRKHVGFNDIVETAKSFSELTAMIRGSEEKAKNSIVHQMMNNNNHQTVEEVIKLLFVNTKMIHQTYDYKSAVSQRLSSNEFRDLKVARCSDNCSSIVFRNRLLRRRGHPRKAERRLWAAILNMLCKEEAMEIVTNIYLDLRALPVKFFSPVIEYEFGSINKMKTFLKMQVNGIVYRSIGEKYSMSECVLDALYCAKRMSPGYYEDYLRRMNSSDIQHQIKCNTSINLENDNQKIVTYLRNAYSNGDISLQGPFLVNNTDDNIIDIYLDELRNTISEEMLIDIVTIPEKPTRWTFILKCLREARDMITRWVQTPLFKWLGLLTVTAASIFAAYKFAVSPKQQKEIEQEIFCEDYPDLTPLQIRELLQANKEQFYAILKTSAYPEDSFDDIYYRLKSDRNIKQETYETILKPKSKQVRVPWNANVVSEGSANAMVIQLINSILARDSLCYLQNSYGTMHFIRIKGNLILVPKHFFLQMKNGDKMTIVINKVKHHVFFDTKRLHNFPEKKDDVVIYQLPETCINAARDITKHFVSEKDLKKAMDCKGYLLHRELEQGYCIRDSIPCVQLVLEPEKDPLVKNGFPDALGVTNYFSRLIKYAIATEPGYCGSPVLTAALEPNGRICGVHTAGTRNADFGLATIVTQEMLQHVISKIEEPAQCAIDPDINGIFHQFKLEDATTPSEHISDQLLYIGNLPNNLRELPPTSTKLKPSTFHNFFPHKEPAVLNPYDKRMDIEFYGQSINDRAFAKYAHEIYAPRSNVMKCLEDQYILEIRNITHPMAQDRRLLEIDECIKGIPGLVNGMDLHTSPGLPWKNMRSKADTKKGKAWMFDDDRNITFQPLVEQLELREQLAMQGKRLPSLAVACLKDETLKDSKIKTGATRNFTCLPLDYNILIKRYFGMFLATMNHHCTTRPSAVGIDPLTRWTELAQRLLEKGNNMFDSDYKNYDANMVGDFVFSFARIVSAWYDDGPVNHMVRCVLLHEGLFTFVVVGRRVYLTFNGNKSGNGLTADINSFINDMYMAYCWVILSLQDGNITWANLRHFRLYVAGTYYGDDLLNSVHETAKQMFHPRRIAELLKEELNMEMTTANKDYNFTFKKLEECTFLKRGFRLCAKTHFYHAPLETTTLYNMLCWNRGNMDPVEATQQILDFCLHEAAQHTIEYYNGFVQKITEACDYHNVRLPEHIIELRTTYDYEHDLWLSHYRT